MSQKQCAEFTLGGMAVIEGVMIKGPKHAVVTVRDEDGVLKTGSRRLRKRSWKIFRWPIVRGLLVFGQTLTLGYWALDFSATEAIGEEEGSPWMMALTMGLAFALGIALFFYLPLLLTQLARDQLGPVLSSEVAFNLLDGVIRILVFLAYVLLISLMPGIRRVFEYHGAEHKVVAAYESEGRTDPEAARKYGTHHQRCGTAFLLMVMVVSILFFSFIPSGSSFLAKLAWRLVMLPAIAGSSFEIIHLATKPYGRSIRWMVAPGLWLQKLTTREPDQEQLEVASAAVQEVIRLEEEEDDRAA